MEDGSSASPSNGVDVIYTPTYTFDGSGTDDSDQNFSSGDAVYDTYGIRKIQISDSFFQLNFTGGPALADWRSENRTVTFTVDGTEVFEGSQGLDANEFQVSTDYILYTLSNQAALADFCVKPENLGAVTINLV